MEPIFSDIQQELERLRIGTRTGLPFSLNTSPIEGCSTSVWVHDDFFRNAYDAEQLLAYLRSIDSRDIHVYIDDEFRGNAWEKMRPFQSEDDKIKDVTV